MLAKGNRSRQVAEACGRHGGFYLGSIGDLRPASPNTASKGRGGRVPRTGDGGHLADRGENFPAFIVIDHQGKDFYDQLVRNRTVQIANG